MVISNKGSLCGDHCRWKPSWLSLKRNAFLVLPKEWSLWQSSKGNASMEEPKQKERNSCRILIERHIGYFERMISMAIFKGIMCTSDSKRKAS